MDRLFAAQRSIESRADAGFDPTRIDRLCLIRAGGLVHVDFYGDYGGESYAEMLDALADPAGSVLVASTEMRGPDVGANGTRNWDLTPLASSSALFPNLRLLSIEQTKPGDHNRTIVARDYDEGGVLAKILAKAPALESLVTPSAPSADFFRVGRHLIEYLSVDAGYDHQGFIANLARSDCFPNLRSLEYGEFNETYMDDFAEHVTPFAHYRELFASPAFAPVKVFRWRNPAVTPEEMAEVKAMMGGRQVMVVRWSGEWLR